MQKGPRQRVRSLEMADRKLANRRRDVVAAMADFQGVPAPRNAKVNSTIPMVIFVPFAESVRIPEFWRLTSVLAGAGHNER